MGAGNLHDSQFDNKNGPFQASQITIPQDSGESPQASDQLDNSTTLNTPKPIDIYGTTPPYPPSRSSWFGKSFCIRYIIPN